MKAMGLYLLFLISLAGITLCDDPFSEESKNQFLNHLLNLHDYKRQEKGLPSLRRTDALDRTATMVLNKKLSENKDRVPKSLGVNYYVDKYNNTNLDHTLANLVFQHWQSLQFDINISIQQRFIKLESYFQIVWDGTKDIGLAVGRNDTHFAIIVLYFPRYNSTAPGQSMPLTIDQGEPSTK